MDCSAWTIPHPEMAKTGESTAGRKGVSLFLSPLRDHKLYKT